MDEWTIYDIIVDEICYTIYAAGVSTGLDACLSVNRSDLGHIGHRIMSFRVTCDRVSTKTPFRRIYAHAVFP